MAGSGDPVVSVAMADFDLMELAPDQVRLQFHLPCLYLSSSIVPFLFLPWSPSVTSAKMAIESFLSPSLFDSFVLLFLLSQVEMKRGAVSEAISFFSVLVVAEGGHCALEGNTIFTEFGDE